ncbi:hypothetical protein Acy02nite_87420 [Actinoplanes cyaneus]|uniref:Uncharacterized protein n=1 Tax=Actinoplanes cyaneus TaxID=52696 RepID=A0A919ITA1_9ACTN|nr:hypothetical protein Acy02nite_87420 [Actinoplanes cyaneus]
MVAAPEMRQSLNASAFSIARERCPIPPSERIVEQPGQPPSQATGEIVSWPRRRRGEQAKAPSQSVSPLYAVPPASASAELSALSATGGWDKKRRCDSQP